MTFDIDLGGRIATKHELGGLLKIRRQQKDEFNWFGLRLFVTSGRAQFDLFGSHLTLPSHVFRLYLV
jgi:hypothetical protein